MNYRLLSAGLIVLAINLSVFSQSVVISESPNPVPEPSAILDVQSTTKGFLPPRLTFNQRNALANPATGLVVYDTDMHKLYVYASDQWVPVVSGEYWGLTEENNLVYNNGDIGIGTGFDIPAAPLHVHGTGTGGGNVLFSGEWKGTPGPAPATGSGTRLVWYPDKASFRAGRVTGSQWNTENTGSYSTAFGYNTTASGEMANAWGSVTTASGAQATAWGFNTIASGKGSTAWGENLTAPSFLETAVGNYNTDYTPAGTTTWDAGDRLFVIGNGTSVASRSDALVMLKNGNLGLGQSSPAYRLHASGSIYASTSNWAIRGVKTGTSGTFPGVWGETESASSNATGVRGFALSTTAGAGSAGVHGRNYGTNTSGSGVRGIHDGGGSGVYGESVSGSGVHGFSSSTTGNTYGIYGRSASPDGFAVYGINNATSGLAIGAQFESSAVSGVALRAIASSTGNDSYGVIGRVFSQFGDAVFGDAGPTSAGRGIWGVGPAAGEAGYFQGDVYVTDNFGVGGTKSFTIDHPHDPTNKVLSHFCIEGPEPYNFYRGTVTLDETGSAQVSLPDYFDAINIDFSYQLTAVGAPMPDLHIGAPISDGKFLVSGGAPGKQVCWEVTALRNDPWVRNEGFQTERNKPEHERGTYIYPQGYGQPEEMQRDYKRIQKARGSELSKTVE